MKFRPILIPVVLITVLSLGCSSVATSQQSEDKQSQRPAHHGKEGAAIGNMSMDKMMKDCMQHHQTAVKSIDQMSNMMESAKQSNDPANLRATIDQSQNQLAEMKEHMAMCGKMMSMMHNMQGMGGMGDMGGMGGMMKHGTK
ncbi:MAG TPA: hypothetical protein VHM64_20030 [Candidatus Binatia bacterium]|nr:hypothetical protein [Candidatus Binatia bacterium]